MTLDGAAVRNTASYTFEDFVEGDSGLLKAAQREAVSIVDDAGARYVLCSRDVFEREKQEAVNAAIS